MEAIKEANGFFDLDGYKYKVRCFAFEAFGEWIDGHDLIGYTNDENFVNLSYPKDVVIGGGVSRAGQFFTKMILVIS